MVDEEQQDTKELSSNIPRSFTFKSGHFLDVVSGWNSIPDDVKKKTFIEEDIDAINAALKGLSVIESEDSRQLSDWPEKPLTVSLDFLNRLFRSKDPGLKIAQNDFFHGVSQQTKNEMSYISTDLDYLPRAFAAKILTQEKLNKRFEQRLLPFSVTASDSLYIMALLDPLVADAAKVNKDLGILYSTWSDKKDDSGFPRALEIVSENMKDVKESIPAEMLEKVDDFDIFQSNIATFSTYYR